MYSWTYLIHVAKNATLERHLLASSWQEDLLQKFSRIGMINIIGFSSFYKLGQTLNNKEATLIHDLGGFPNLYGGPMASFREFIEYLISKPAVFEPALPDLQRSLKEISQTTLVVIEAWDGD